MPSPVVLEVRLAPEGPAVRPMANSRMVDEVDRHARTKSEGGWAP